MVKEMVEGDVNDGWMIIWRNGNEGGWNYEVDKVFGE